VAKLEPGEYRVSVMCDRDVLQVYSKPFVVTVD